MSASFSPGTFVWFPSDNTKILQSGTVVSVSGSNAVVTGRNEATFTVPIASLRAMHQTSIDGVENMISLSDLHVGSILRNLAMRYANDEIYTFTGSILIAMNPFKQLGIYDNDNAKKYQGVRLGELPPHIFAIADETLFCLLRDKSNQCVVISGESGAGKTDSTNLILNYLAHLSGKHSYIEDQLLASSPVLEAFGNAKTVRNNNSSRFGKFMEIQFTSEGHIEGARINEYLLEKSRIVAQAKNERNYHIFYNLLAGASPEEKQLFRIKNAENYRLLNSSGCYVVSTINDNSAYDHVKGAMGDLRMSDQTINDIMRVVASVLHVGNIEFIAVSDDSSKVNEKNGAVEDAAKVLGVESKSLAHSLVHRINQTQRETITASLNVEKANDSRDALAKAIYGALFSTIVVMLNKVICSSAPSGLFIGVLDIFGFEDFAVNSFEQLCINYANEKLQQFFNQHIFKLEQEEYDKEEINWSKIDFVDNQQCLDLISKKLVGILQILDEECNFPRATDLTMLEKLHSNHAGKTPHPYYVKPKLAKNTFGVVHYAGTVNYDVTNFLEKNRDKLRDDLEQLMRSSSVSFVKSMFSQQPASSVEASPSKGGKSGTSAGAPSGGKIQTVGARFHESLTQLMFTLTACNPFFVRCIKPNAQQSPNQLQEELVEAQLRYSGLLETVRIRKAGFTTRLLFLSFLKLYRHNVRWTKLAKGFATLDDKQKCKAVLHSVGAEEAENWQIGKTKVFMRDTVESKLEKKRFVIMRLAAMTIQRWVRRLAARRLVKKQHKAATDIQRIARGYLVRRFYLKRKFAAVKIQQTFRGYRIRRRYRLFGTQVQRIQIALRIRLAREAIVAFSVQAQREAMAIRARQAERQRLKLEKERQLQEKKQRAKESEGLQAELQKEKAKVAALMKEEQQAMYSKLPAKLRKSDANIREIEIANNMMESIEKQIATLAAESAAAAPSEDIQARQVLKDIDFDIPFHQYINIPVMVPLKKSGSRASIQSDGRKSGFDFSKYAKKYFRNGLDHRFSSFPLSSALLESTPESSEEDAITISTLIMAFMGDHVLPSPISPLQLARQLIMLCLREPVLRDEYYCQLVKQLTQNPKSGSKERGYQLLVLSLLCFIPTTAFIEWLTAHVENLVTEPYSTMGSTVLSIMNSNQRPRELPISEIEFELITQHKSLDLKLSIQTPVENWEYFDMSVPIYCSVEEALMTAQKAYGLDGVQGLNLKLILSSGEERHLHRNDWLMDAVAHAEVDGFSSKGRLQVMLFKQLYVANEPVDGDGRVLEMAYYQIVGRIHLPLFDCSKENAVYLAAIQYQLSYVNTKTREPPVLSQVQQFYVPPKMYNLLDEIQWETKIRDVINSITKLDAHALKVAAVNRARNMPAMFCQRYVAKCIGDTGPRVFADTGVETTDYKLEIGIDRAGLHLIDTKSKHLLFSVSFFDVQHYDASKDTFEFAAGDLDYFFKCDRGLVAKNYVFNVINVLLAESKRCVAKQAHEGGKDLLAFEKDDLIEILERNDMTGWWRGQFEGHVGWFPSDIVETIVLRPRKQQSVDHLKKKLQVKPVPKPVVETKEEKEETLEQQYSMLNYARNFFRDAPTPKSSPAKLAVKEERGRRASGSESTLRVVEDSNAADWGWRDLVKMIKFSKTPIKQSLLKHYTDDDNSLAIDMFKVVMQFMGDANSNRTPAELAVWIIARCLERQAMRDELYCQVIKQTTSNPGRKGESTKMGWILLELCIGCFPPSATFDPFLRKHLQSFSLHKGRDFHDSAIRCEAKLRMIKRNSARTVAPLADELQFAINKALFAKVTFPDLSQKALEIWSCTTAKDIVSTICKRLDLENHEQYSIYTEHRGDVSMVFENQYLMDRITALRKDFDQAVRAQKKGEADLGRFEYKLLFRKSIWLKGEVIDPKNQQLVHIAYHQTLQHLMKGDYRCGPDDAVELAAVQIRAAESTDALTIKRRQSSVGLDKEKEEIYKSYIIPTLLSSFAMPEWVRAIDAAIATCRDDDVNTCKYKFVKRVQAWSLFGCSFYHIIKPKSDRVNLPPEAILAINHEGVKFIHVDSKIAIVSYQYKELASWRYGPEQINFKIGGFVQRVQRNVRGITPKGQDICYTISAYAKALAAQMPQAPAGDGKQPSRNFVSMLRR